MRLLLARLGITIASTLVLAPRPAYAQPSPTYLVDNWGEVHGARMLSAVVSDPLRKRALLFGGLTSGGVRNDTLEWDGVGWTRRTPSVIPDPRYSAAIAYDSVRRRVIMFGGAKAQSPNGFVITDNRVWEWNGSDWKVLPTQGTPSARASMAIASQPTTGEIWMFGGANESAAFDELYRFDGLRWTLVPKTAGQPWPSARTNAAMAFDAASQKYLLFGGFDKVSFSARGVPDVDKVFVDTWTWDGTRWEQLVVSGGPTNDQVVPIGDVSVPLSGSNRIVTDAAGALHLVHEAFDGIRVWRWTMPNTWSEEYQPSTPATPNLRPFTNGFWDWARAEIHLVGGLQTAIPSGISILELRELVKNTLFDGTLASDEWGWNGTTWRQWRSPGDPGARFATAAAVHAGLGAGILFGGRFGASTVAGDTWIWDGGRWSTGTNLAGANGTAPAPRAGHAMAYDPNRAGPGGTGAVVLFGGRNAANVLLNDTWIWRDGWQKLAVDSGAPAPREEHVLVGAPDGIVLYGGSSSPTARYRETWFLGSTATAWVNRNQALETYGSMCAAAMGAEAYQYGGLSPSSTAPKASFARLANATWSPVELPVDNPEGRSGCSLFGVPSRGQLLLAGGTGDGEGKSNWYQLALASQIWQPVDLEPRDPGGDTPGRLSSSAYFDDPISRSPIFYGGVSRELGTIVSHGWRVRQLGDVCDPSTPCLDGLTCVDGACCEASACGPCESCATTEARGLCRPRGEYGPVPGCGAAEGLACARDGRCRANEGAECTESAQCASSSCVIARGRGVCCGEAGCAPSCIDETRRRNEDGTTSECQEYKCLESACRSSCNGIDDCAPGFECADRKCVTPMPPGGQPRGCECESARVQVDFGAGLRAGGMLALLGLVLATRRRPRAPSQGDARSR